MASSDDDARLAQVIGLDGMSVEELFAVRQVLRDISKAQGVFGEALSSVGIGGERQRIVWTRVVAAIAEGITQIEREK
jgi:hypothetical protein